MALKLADALLYLATDDSGLDAGLSSAEKKTQGWAGKLGGTVTNLLGGVVVAGAAAAAAAVVSVGVAAFDVSKQTDKAAADIAASLGIPKEAALEFAEVARQVFGNNFADSVGEAGEAVAEIAKQLRLTADDPALKTITENAFRLRDTFGVDVSESVSAVRTLMENFGLTADEAFDLLARGYQKGLDRSGDFIDTVEEYSVQFSNSGASASEFFSLLESGLQGGMLGTDKAADAFKEFAIRIVDGSKTTREGLEGIGLSAAEMEAAIASGQMTVAEAFQLVIDKLRATEDPIARNQAGVALIGTQYEDLTDAVATNLDMTRDWAAESEGAISSLDAKYETFGSAVEAIWRRLIVSISPFTDKLLELVNDAMPKVIAAFDWFDATVGPAVERTGQVIGSVVEFIRGIFADLQADTDKNTERFAFFKEWIDTNMPLVQSLVEKVIGAINAWWEKHGETVMTFVNVTLANAFQIIDTILKNLLDLVTVTLQLLNGDWEAAGKTLEGIVERTWGAVRDIVTRSLSGLATIVSNEATNLYNAGKDLIGNLWNGISERFNQLISDARAKLQELMDLLPGSEPKDPNSPLRGLGGRGFAIGENLLKGMNQGLANLAGGTIGAIAELINAGLGTARDLLGIGSSSTAGVGMELGEGFGAGLAQGIRNQIAAVVAAIRELAAMAMAEMTALMAQAGNVGGAAGGQTSGNVSGQSPTAAGPSFDAFGNLAQETVRWMVNPQNIAELQRRIFEFSGLRLFEDLSLGQRSGEPSFTAFGNLGKAAFELEASTANLAELQRRIFEMTQGALRLAEDFSLVPASFSAQAAQAGAAAANVITQNVAGPIFDAFGNLAKGAVSWMVNPQNIAELQRRIFEFSGLRLFEDLSLGQRSGEPSFTAFGNLGKAAFELTIQTQNLAELQRKIFEMTQGALRLAEDFSLVPAAGGTTNNFNVYVTSTGDAAADVENRIDLYRMVYG